MKKDKSVAIIGGAGHVGLPLGIMFASRGVDTLLYDINIKALKTIGNGKMPFIEHGADELLVPALVTQKLKMSNDLKDISTYKYVILCIGTPVDKYTNPEIELFLKSVREVISHMRAEQVLLIRSTVFPGTCGKVGALCEGRGIDVLYCPERITQGYSIKELNTLPQIIAPVNCGPDGIAFREVAELFQETLPAIDIVRCKPIEAELTKLFTNTHRYIQFAIANEFYKICQENGADYEIVQEAMTHKYPRIPDLPAAGLAAGPCLLKDTLQLVNLYPEFALGSAAHKVNETFPNYLADIVQYNCGGVGQSNKVALLGMTFKADIDDTRDSLSFKLKNILEFRGFEVICCDPYIPEYKDNFARVLYGQWLSAVVVCVPHKEYQGIGKKITRSIVINPWGEI